MSFSFTFFIFLLFIKISPFFGLFILAIVFRSVDFPHPFAAIIILIFPYGLQRFIFSIITSLSYATLKFFTLIASIIISPSSLNK